jgi:hypothetical protein
MPDTQLSDVIPFPALMKYYIYISDAKVDMLFPQVPHEIKKKVALEFKMDLKLLSASRKTETETEDNRIARLETVADFIRQFGKVGSVDQPDEYIDDCMTLKWGDYAAGWDEKSPVVYFGGETDRTIVGLGGSSKHIIGSQGETSSHSHSATPFLIKFLAEELGLQGSKKLKQAEEDIKYLGDGRFSPITAVELATLQMNGPEQRLEFLAKKLMYGPVQRYDDEPEYRDKHVLLATPLYMALAD